jgi:hypothetical protein
VVDTYVHENVSTYDVETTAGTVTSTPEHPFYVQGKGWVPVRELRSGDRLVDPKGSEVDVVSVAPTGETATVYNFNVDDLHTYHVATGRDTWVRVHNTCTPPSRFVTTQSGVTIDRNSINASVSVQKQGRHVLGAREYNGTKSYFNSHADAQQVLDDFHSGAADVMGVKGNDVVVRTNGVTGYNMNPGANILHQPTNVFFIKGTVKPSVVPYNPTWTP